jgi:ubiquinone/menaquinone biosynthesis C-methylase UbiE
MKSNQQDLTEKIKNSLSSTDQSAKWDTMDATDPDYMMYSPKSVGYNTTAEQKYLMQNLLIGYDGSSILDVGCGRCDLYGVIQELFGTPTNYSAIDHNPIMANIGKQKWNLENIQVGAYETANLPNAEWVVASGLFTERKCDTEDADLQKVFEDIAILYDHATKVVSFNLLNPINTTHYPGFLYIHPGLILDMLIEKYKHVSVRANYSNDVYTILIYKF